MQHRSCYAEALSSSNNTVRIQLKSLGLTSLGQKFSTVAWQLVEFLRSGPIKDQRPSAGLSYPRLALAAAAAAARSAVTSGWLNKRGNERAFHLSLEKEEEEECFLCGVLCCVVCLKPSALSRNDDVGAKAARRASYVL